MFVQDRLGQKFVSAKLPQSKASHFFKTGIRLHEAKERFSRTLLSILQNWIMFDAGEYIVNLDSLLLAIIDIYN